MTFKTVTFAIYTLVPKVLSTSEATLEIIFFVNALKRSFVAA
jgi:hypothetical protein